MLAASLNNLIGGRQQRLRDGEAEGLGGLEVDDELVLGRLLYRQVSRLCALENAGDVLGGKLVVRRPRIRTIAYQAATNGKSSRRIHSWNGVTCCQSHDLVEISEGKSPKNESADATFNHGCERLFEISVIAAFHNHNLQAELLTSLEH